MKVVSRCGMIHRSILRMYTRTYTPVAHPVCSCLQASSSPLMLSWSPKYDIMQPIFKSKARMTGCSRQGRARERIHVCLASDFLGWDTSFKFGTYNTSIYMSYFSGQILLVADFTSAPHLSSHTRKEIMHAGYAGTYKVLSKHCARDCMGSSMPSQ